MKKFNKKELYNLAWEKPTMAQVELTRNCNQKCIFCFSGHSENKAYENLSLSEWMSILRKLYDIGVRRIDLTGSESFLYPDLLQLLKQAKEMGFAIRMDTNGTFDITPVLTFVDELAFSIHGIGEVHDEITGRPGSFNALEKNVTKAFASDVKVQINMTLIKKNYHQISEVFQYFSKHSPSFTFSPFMAIPSNFGNAFESHMLEIDEKIIGEYLGVLKTLPTERIILKHGFHSIFMNDPKHYRSSGLLLPNCAAGKYKLVVDYDGSVFPCNFFRSENYYCGNILRDNAENIWKNGNGFMPFRTLVLEEKIPIDCKACIKKDRCFSGCRAWSKEYRKGGFEYAKDMRCAFGHAYIGSGDNQ